MMTPIAEPMTDKEIRTAADWYADMQITIETIE